MKKNIALLLITLVTIQTTKAQENGQDEFGILDDVFWKCPPV